MLRTTNSRLSSRALRRLTSIQSIQSIPSKCPSRQFATVKAEEKDPVDLDQLTTLPNGLRVATEALPGHFSGIGVYLDAGSRYETPALSGVSHIVDRLAFKSTSRRTSDQMIEMLESLGGNIQCASSRESLMYQSATFNSRVEDCVALLAETIRDPLITEEEIQQQLETAQYEIGEIWSRPELILPEAVHMAAYKGNTLGNPLLCPAERLSEINRSTVEAYRNTFFRPERMVVAFAGVNHTEAVKLTEQYFGDMPKSPVLSQVGAGTSINTNTKSEQSSTTQSLQPNVAYSASTPQESRLLSKIPFLKNLSTSAKRSATHADTSILTSDVTSSNLTTPAHYTGGFLSLPHIQPPPNPAHPRLSYIHLAFETPGIASEDIYALATLQTLLGGGGSFSAGGPGKGMYSRLYTNVLNQYSSVENCVAFNHSYSDSGLFGISASCDPRAIRNMLEVMCRELASLSQPTGYSALKEGEVKRAKNQLRSGLLMNLESRMVELEDLGRQVQVHGRKVGVKEMCDKIEATTIADLRRVAAQVFGGNVENPGKGSGAPTVVLQEGLLDGEVTKKGFEWEDIQARIAKWKLGKR
ncbi:putative mitochondrial processing peptidase alpha subunit [Saccharata proteae CBS 121410]|uniref:Mitochondrial-processing peptidase subunit alpha n=1 Tax=Saccharata proteae CBS 121410 TaxID=1314787 RepID=A0A9P4HNW2_9PEZI|nr:putative mitochondrial processing peptidase alpha subunit [Saccharata proteae CBS 121410]